MLPALDAPALRRWYQWGLAALHDLREEIDSLNVFPVPDGDTGTNLHLTLECAVRAVDAGERQAGTASRPDPARLARLAGSMARTAVLGARGSSGVILSQLLRGVAEVVTADAQPPRGRALARALAHAVDLAYAAVSQPVEGTMLTVARAAADAAAAANSDDLGVVVAAASEAAAVALARTPDQLAVLGHAGVVDAGGRGIVVLLEVLRAVVEERAQPKLEPTIAHPVLDWPGGATSAVPAFEVMYLLRAPEAAVPMLRRGLDNIGDSVVVSGGDGLWSVHVHTDDPHAAVAAGESASGFGDGPSADAADGRAGRPQRIRVVPLHTLADEQPAHRRALTVVADSTRLALALALLCRESGARVATSDVAGDAAAAAQLVAPDVSESTVVVLGPTALFDRLAAAGHAAREHGVEVEVVHVDGVAPLLAALAVHDGSRVQRTDVQEMREAAGRTRHGVVAPHGLQAIATADVGDTFSDADVVAAATKLVGALGAANAELVTIVGAAATAERIAARVTVAHPQVEVEVIEAAVEPHVWIGVA